MKLVTNKYATFSFKTKDPETGYIAEGDVFKAHVYFNRQIEKLLYMSNRSSPKNDYSKISASIAISNKGLMKRIEQNRRNVTISIDSIDYHIIDIKPYFMTNSTGGEILLAEGTIT